MESTEGRVSLNLVLAKLKANHGNSVDWKVAYISLVWSPGEQK
jgi:hypothetical protein